MSEAVAINPKRLQWCLDDFAMDRTTLASVLHVGEKTLSASLRGEPALTFQQLQNLARYFGRGVLFFLDSSPVDAGLVHSVQFRTIRNKLPQVNHEIRKLVEKAEWQREIYLSLLAEGAEDGENYVLPDYSALSPREAAARARQWLGLEGEQDIETYREALESNGVLVFRAQGYSGQWHWDKASPLLGFSLFFSEHPVIVLKRETWESQQAFTLMHELGHLMLHRSGSIDGGTDFSSHERMEVEANQFAGYLLVPDVTLSMVRDSDRPQDPGRYEVWVAPLTRLCGVSAEVVLRRLTDAGRLTIENYNAYRQGRPDRPVPVVKKAPRTYRHREPLHILGNHYVRTVLDALGARRITIPKASAYLDNLKLDDLHALERHVAGL